jgi:excisionase family DNA binding protein
MNEKLAALIESFDTALTVNQLAKILAVSAMSIYRRAAAGLIPCFHQGSSVRFDPGDVAAWLRLQ